MSAADAFYVTTPIYYVNDKPHIGHAYTTIACDTMARFMRLDGKRVKFLTGTDEHGQKVAKSAEKAGVTPQQFVDEVSERFRALTRLLDVTNDDFIRTTEERHVKACQALWKELEARGEIYLGSYAGWYSVRDEAFYAESELVNGKAPTGAEVEWVEEPSYFFRLSKWQDRLIEHYERNPDAIMPESRRNEVLSFLKSGLRDLSVSRTTFDWGIPVPGDPDHVMYVWIDALTNYITALGYPDTETSDYQTFWPAIHVVGKDILRFHAVYWPAMLMAAGLEPPKRVFAHGWWTIEGEKMSKSLGNVVDPHDMIGEWGLDQSRYFLLREVPFGNDGDFSRDALLSRVNNDLANDFGNLVQRVLSMVGRYCDKSVPEPGASAAELAEEPLLASAYGLLERVRTLVEQQAFHKALEEIWRVVSAANRYVDSSAPWALRKTDTAAMQRVLYVLAETIRLLALVAQPFVPGAATKILDQLSVPADARDFAHFGPDHALKPGAELPKPTPVFPRVDRSETA